MDATNIFAAIAFALLMLISWIGGSHTAMKNTRNFIQAYDDLLKQVSELQTRYAEIVRENAVLKGEIIDLKSQLKNAMNEIAHLSGELAAHGDQDSSS